jgi:DNA (cytosine-5)-methyltransferase 1
MYIQQKLRLYMSRPLAIDLFAGCGGMSLGLEAAGFDIVAAVEFDAVHTLVHHYNFPYSASICRDIAKLSAEELLRQVEEKGYSREIDLIAGGPPCQGFSHMGKRQLDDPRNALVFEYVRLIKEIKPKYFIFENVPGIATGKHRQFLDELIVEFESIGYTIEKPISILDASLYGAPQKRKRLIILGSRLDVTQVSYPATTHASINDNELPLFEIIETPLSTCKDAIGDLANQIAFTEAGKSINANLLDYSGFRANYALKPSGKFSLCHLRQVSQEVYGHLGSKHTVNTIEKFQATVPGKIEKTSRFFKLASDGQCNTLRAGTASDKGAFTAPRPIHYEVPRCITVREAARLHTFPDWFRFHNTIWHGFREIGNAVIPFLSKALGDQIVDALELNRESFKIYKLPPQNPEFLTYNMAQASKYWNIPDDVIPKRKKLNKDAA